MGLRNLLGITGDVRTLGDIPDATAVFDVDSIGLTNLLTRLNHGLDVGGQPIGAPTAFHVGVMVNPAADDLDAELRRFEYKVEAGAEYAVTRPVFDVAAMERFVERTQRLPHSDHRRACGRSRARSTPSSWPTRCRASRCRRRCLQRMRRPLVTKRPSEEGVRIAQELGAALRPMVQGLHISARRQSRARVETLDACDRRGTGRTTTDHG